MAIPVFDQERYGVRAARIMEVLEQPEGRTVTEILQLLGVNSFVERNAVNQQLYRLKQLGFVRKHNRGRYYRPATT